MLRLIFKQYFITLTLNNVIQIIFKYPKPIKNYRIVIIIYMINKNNTAKPYINYYYRGLNIIRRSRILYKKHKNIRYNTNNYNSKMHK